MDLKTFRTAFNAWKHGSGAWGDVWQKFSRQPAPELPEGPPEAPIVKAKLPERNEGQKSCLASQEFQSAELPAAKVESPANVAELQNSIVNLRAELADVRGQLDHKALMLERLERSKGIAAAQVILNVPTFGDGNSLIDTFNALPDGPERTAFYNEHKNQLIAFIGKSDSKVMPYTR